MSVRVYKNQSRKSESFVNFLCVLIETRVARLYFETNPDQVQTNADRKYKQEVAYQLKH